MDLLRNVAVGIVQSVLAFFSMKKAKKQLNEDAQMLSGEKPQSSTPETVSSHGEIIQQITISLSSADWNCVRWFRGNILPLAKALHLFCYSVLRHE